MSLSLQDFHRVVGGLAHEFEATGLHPSQYHTWAIRRMNQMYSLPINTTPSLDKLNESPVTRMTGFLKTLRDEMDEGLEILAMLVIREMRQAGDAVTPHVIQELIKSLGIKDPKRAQDTFNQITSMVANDTDRYHDTYSEDVLVAIADWLGDMKVYIDSESLKYGIMLSPVLACIMGSNFTKLNERGEVIKDANGKVQKGPNFTPPEEAIRAVLFGTQALLDEAGEVNARVNAINSVAVSVALANPDMDVFAEPEQEEGPNYPAQYGNDEIISSVEELPVVKSRSPQADDGLLPE
jgi:hypothetical protein